MGLRQNFHWTVFWTLSLAALSGANAQEDTPTEPAAVQQAGDDTLTAASPVTPIDARQTEALSWYMRGIEAQQNNQIEDALRAFREASKADPQAPDPVRAEAMLLFRTRKVDEGIDRAQTAIELDPGDFRTRFQLATILLQRNPTPATLTDSIRLMDEALASDRLQPADEEFLLIHSIRGRLLLRVSQNGKAAESYAVLLQALERPEDFGLDFRRHQGLMEDRLTSFEAVGEALLSVGRVEEALRAFKAQAKRSNDEPGRIHLLMATAQFRADQLEAAEASLETYFESGQRDKVALQLLKQIYAATARSSDLVERLTSLRSDTPDETTVDLYLAEIQLQQGRIEEAIATLERVIIESGDPAAYPGLIRVDILRANADSLISTLQKAFRARIQITEITPFLPEILNDADFAQQVVDACLAAIDRNDQLFPEVTYLCARLADEIDADEEQTRLLEATLKRNPNQRIGLATMQQMGMHFLRISNGPKAAETFRRLLAMQSLSNQGRVQILTNLAKAESISDRYEQALEAIQAAMSLAPDQPDLPYWLGWVHLNADRIDESRKALQQCINMANQPILQNMARMLLAMSYSQQQEWDRCIEQYRQVIDNPTDDRDTHRRAQLLLSAIYVELGNNPEAEKVLEVLFADQPDDPGVNNDLGYLYADQNKNLDQALEMIELAVDADPDNRAYLDSLGWILYRLERYDEALDALQKANSDPDFQDATLQEHLGDVYDAMDRGDEARDMWQKALKTEETAESPKPDVLKRLRSRLEESSAAADEPDKPQQPALEDSVPVEPAPAS